MTIRDVVRVTAAHYGVTVAQVLGGSRPPRLVEARAMAMFLARRLLRASYPEIGRELGKHHTTVLAAVAKAHGRLMDDPVFVRHAVVVTRALRAREPQVLDLGDISGELADLMGGHSS